MRRYISAEMWTRLNRSYLRLRELGIQEIWRPSPESFYADTAAQIDTFAGVAAATMYHDAGWRFMRLGRSIERAQLATALLLAHLAVERTGDDQHEDDWISLLRCGYALEAYHRRCSVAVEPERVLDLLVTDALLPGSLCHALDGVRARGGRGTRRHRSRPARRLQCGRTALTPSGSLPRSTTSGLTGRTGRSCCCRSTSTAATCTSWWPTPTSITPWRAFPAADARRRRSH